MCIINTDPVYCMFPSCPPAGQPKRGGVKLSRLGAGGESLIGCVICYSEGQSSCLLTGIR